MSKIFLDNQSPRTNFIMGAVLSGGDPLVAARMCLPEETPKPMPQIDVTFRGEEKTVVIDQYGADPDTNALEVAWHFEDVPPHMHDKLSITDDEDEAIVEAIATYMNDHAYEED